MTTIAAIQTEHFVVIGADSQSSGEDGFSIDIPDGKIFNNNGVIIAGAGAVRGINLLQHNFVAPKIGRANTDRYIAKTLIPAMRKLFDEHGYEVKRNDSSAENDNIWIVAINGECYRIDEDYSFERTNNNVYTAGSGERFATGAIEALIHSFDLSIVDDVEILVKNAISIAAKYDAFTGGEIKTVIQLR
jgi:ATP-dependent protease HslVU (ClpYQ) peptidase subunit